jgi:hypothetical protein
MHLIRGGRGGMTPKPEFRGAILDVKVTQWHIRDEKVRELGMAVCVVFVHRLPHAFRSSHSGVGSQPVENWLVSQIPCAGQPLSLRQPTHLRIRGLQHEWIEVHILKQQILIGNRWTLQEVGY